LVHLIYTLDAGLVDLPHQSGKKRYSDVFACMAVGDNIWRFFHPGVKTRIKGRLYMAAFRLLQHLDAPDGIFHRCEESARLTIVHGRRPGRRDKSVSWLEAFEPAMDHALESLQRPAISKYCLAGAPYTWMALDKERAPTTYIMNGLMTPTERKAECGWRVQDSEVDTASTVGSLGKRGRDSDEESTVSFDRVGRKARRQRKTMTLYCGNVVWRRPVMEDRNAKWMAENQAELQELSERDWEVWEREAERPWMYYQGNYQRRWPPGPRAAMMAVLADPTAMECWSDVMRRGGAESAVWWRSLFRPHLTRVLLLALREMRAGTTDMLESAVADLLRAWMVRGGLAAAPAPRVRWPGMQPPSPSSAGSVAAGTWDDPEAQEMAEIARLRDEAAGREQELEARRAARAPVAVEMGPGHASSGQAAADGGLRQDLSTPFFSMSEDMGALMVGPGAVATPPTLPTARNKDSPFGAETMTRSAQACLDDGTAVAALPFSPGLGAPMMAGALPSPMGSPGVEMAAAGYDDLFAGSSLPATPLSFGTPGLLPPSSEEGKELYETTSSSERSPPLEDVWMGNGSQMRSEEQRWATETEVAEAGLMPCSPAVVRLRSLRELGDGHVHLYELDGKGRAWLMDPREGEDELEARGVRRVDPEAVWRREGARWELTSDSAEAARCARVGGIPAVWPRSETLEALVGRVETAME
jgi:hypothetical protein